MDPEDYDLPDVVRDAPDHLFVVQQFDMTTTQNIENASYEENTYPNEFSFAPSIPNLDEFRMVNGMYQPDLTMKPNEWQRWRVVYAGWDAGSLDLEVDGCEMVLLAKDSIYISDFG